MVALAVGVLPKRKAPLARADEVIE